MFLEENFGIFCCLRLLVLFHGVLIVESVMPSSQTLETWGETFLADVEIWMTAWTAQREVKEKYKTLRDFGYFYESNLPDWTIELPLIATQIEKHLQKSIAAPVSISKAAENLSQTQYNTLKSKNSQSLVWYNNTYFERLPNGSVSNSVFDEQYNCLINRSISFVKLPSDVWSQTPAVLDDIAWTMELTDTFKNNLYQLSSDLYWQYFATPKGITRIYPASQIKTVNIFDSRFEDWYVQASTLSKLIIIAIDSSGSVNGQVTTFIDITAKYVLNTLTDNDYINIVYFKNDLVKALASKSKLRKFQIRNCDLDYSPENFIRASKNNVQKLKTVLKLHQNYNSTADFALLFKNASEMFSKGEQELKRCTKVLLLLTDGGKGSILAKGGDRELEKLAKTHPDMRLLIALEGQDVFNSKNSGVEKLACRYNGYYHPISSAEAIREQTVNFVNVLSQHHIMNNFSEILWTNPRYNSWARNLGFVITVTLPAHNQTNQAETLLGVAATDVPLAWLDKFIPWAQLGIGSDIYIVNQKGVIIYLQDINQLSSIANSIAFVPEIDYLDMVSDGFNYKQAIMETIYPTITHYSNRYISRDRIKYALNLSSGKITSVKIKNTPFTLAIDVPNLSELYIKPFLKQKLLVDVRDIQLLSSHLLEDLKEGFYLDSRSYCTKIQPNAVLLSSRELINAISALIENNDVSSCNEAFYQMLTGTLLSDSWKNALHKHTGAKNEIINSFLYTIGGTLITFDKNRDNMLTTSLVNHFQANTESIMTTQNWEYTFFMEYNSIFEGDLNCFRWTREQDLARKQANSSTDARYSVFIAKALTNQQSSVRFGFTGIQVSQQYLQKKWKLIADRHCAGYFTSKSCYILDHGGFILSSNIDDPNRLDKHAYQLGVSFRDIDPCMMSELVRKGVYKTMETVTTPCRCRLEPQQGSSAGGRIHSLLWTMLTSIYSIIMSILSTSMYSWIVDYTLFPINTAWSVNYMTDGGKKASREWVKTDKRCEYQTTIYYYGDETSVSQGLQISCGSRCNCTAERTYSAQRIRNTNMLFLVIQEKNEVYRGLVASECSHCRHDKRVRKIPEVIQVIDNPSSSRNEDGKPIKEYKVNTCNYKPYFTTQTLFDKCVPTHEKESRQRACSSSCVLKVNRIYLVIATILLLYNS